MGTSKTEIRREMRAARAALDAETWASHSARICQQLLSHPWLTNAQGVALYDPLLARQEVDVRAVATVLRQRGVPLFYPAISGVDSTGATGEFRRVELETDFQLGPFGVKQPAVHCRLASAAEVDLVVVPCLAADARGFRVGYGAGFYDRSLRQLCPPAKCILVAFSFQVIDAVPHDPHDIACHCVLTEQGVLTVADVQ